MKNRVYDFALPVEILFRIKQRWNITLDRLLASRYTRHALSFAAEFMASSAYETITKRFYEPFRDPENAVKNYKTIFQNAQPHIIREAGSICRKRYPILGRKDVSYGDPPSWHLDFLSSKKAPSAFYSRINYLDSVKYGDHKVIWELNRHQFLPILGKAYWITGNERYALEWMAQTDDWMRANPPKIGINWSSSLEIAFRSINWIWAWFFFSKSRLAPTHFIKNYLGFLHLNGLHIERNLSIYFSPNTHLTGEALALVYLGLFFYETPDGDRWLKNGMEILLEQLCIHVKEDGTYFEQSTYYHKYTTDFYLHLYILMQINGWTVPQILTDRLQKLIDFLVWTQMPDGKSPLVGDDDGGRLLFLNNSEYNDFRSAVSTAAVLFRNPVYKECAGRYDEETFWLLGLSSREEYNRLESSTPQNGSRALAAGGYFILRNGWKDKSDFMMIDCGDHGWRNCGHAHADLLSFILWVNGEPFLIDPGTYTYTNKEWRNYFRSSQAHNTISVDGKSHSTPADAFSWKSIAFPESTSWFTCDEFDAFSGTASIAHESVSHRRDVVHLKSEGVWFITDRLRSEGQRDFHLHFHFASDRVDLRSNRFIMSDEKNILGMLAVFSSGPFKLSLMDDWKSPVYSMKEPVKTGISRFSSGKPVVSILTARVDAFQWRAEETGQLLVISGEGCNNRTVNYCLNLKYPEETEIKGIRSDCESLILKESPQAVQVIIFNAVSVFIRDILKIQFRKRLDTIRILRDLHSCAVLGSPECDFDIEQMDDCCSITINRNPVKKEFVCAASAELH